MDANEFGEMKRNANDLRSKGDFVGGRAIYEQIWQTTEGKSDKWVGWGYAQCLNKEKQYGKSLAICQEVYKLDNDFGFNNNLYGWNIYHEVIKGDKVQDVARYMKAANAIVQLTKQGQFSPYTKTAMKVMEYCMQNSNSKEAVLWAGKLDGLQLESKGSRFTDQEGIEREVASEQENYFRIYSKALLKSRQYEECIEVATLALQHISEFHGSNDIWLKRNMAISYIGQGANEKALALLQEIILVKKDWFLHNDLSEIYVNVGDKEKALYHAVTAAIGAKDKLSLKLVARLASLFTERGQREDGQKHIEFYLAFKQNNDQTIDKMLPVLAAEYKVNMDSIGNLNTLQKDINKLWQDTKNSMREVHTGIVEKLIGDGQAGFVKKTNGPSIYFKTRSFRGNKTLLQPGFKVKFYIEESFDVKKNKASLMAVELVEDRDGIR